MSSKNLFRALVATCAAVAVTATMGASAFADPTPSATPSATPSPSASATATADELTSGRVFGADRYETATILSGLFDPGPNVAYVASGTGFADALSAAPAAAWVGGPLLLVQQNAVPAVVQKELERLKPKTIVVVGGTGVISDAVYAKLAGYAPSIRRDAGANRYETSRIVTDHAFSGGDAVEGTFVATGRDFPDALSAGSAAGAWGVPVVLVDGKSTTVDAATVALFKKLGIGQVAIAGGTGAVSAAFETSLTKNGLTTDRYAGTDRYDTSFKINDDRDLYDEVKKAKGTIEEGIFATGTNYADALAGAAYAGVRGEPLWVVPSTCVPSKVLATGTRLGLPSYVLLGGPSVLSNDVEALKTCS